MNTKHTKCALIYLSSLLILGSGLHAHEDHAPINSRPLSEEIIAQIAEQGEAAEETATGVEETLTHTTEFGFKNRTEWFSSQRDDSVAYYELADINSNQCIVLSDGSEWKPASEDFQKMQRWKRDNQIVIMVDKSWSDAVKSQKKYMYRLVNKSKGNSEVKANPYLGPNVHSSEYRTVNGISNAGLQVFLNDSSGWIIAPEDGALFKEWRVNDTIMIGLYNRWFTSYDYILINVDSNHYVRAKQI